MLKVRLLFGQEWLKIKKTALCRLFTGSLFNQRLDRLSYHDRLCSLFYVFFLR